LLKLFVASFFFINVGMTNKQHPEP